MSTTPPRSLRVINKIVIGLQRVGIALGPMHLLTVAGRRTGRPRTTPVATFEVDGDRYIVGGYRDGDWVRNVRAAGSAVLSRGRRRQAVRLVELPVHARGRILREFPVQVPHGVGMFVRNGVVTEPTPEQFEQAADKVTVFRIETVQPADDPRDQDCPPSPA